MRKLLSLAGAPSLPVLLILFSPEAWWNAAIARIKRLCWRPKRRTTGHQNGTAKGHRVPDPGHADGQGQASQ